MNSMTAFLLTGVLSAWSATGAAQVQDPPSPPPPVTAVSPSSGGSQVQNRLVSRFTTWAGSDANARSLVTGLRQGSEITLAAPGTGGSAGTGTTFTPPTRPMGYGNIRIALALAQAQLAQGGITQPTSAQLQTALMGGVVTNGTGTAAAEFRGVLQMRADGMGWGQIANSMGMKLGHVLSGKASLPVPPSPSTATSDSTGTGAGAGVTTAAGATAASAQARSRGNSGAAQAAHRSRPGIVTAAGDPAAGVSAGMGVKGGGNGAGIVTGTGTTARANSSSRGFAKGQGRN